MTTSGGKTRTTLSPAGMTSSFRSSAASAKVGRRDLQLEADHQPLAADLLDHGAVAILELREPLAHVETEPGDPLEEARREDDVEGGVADRHRQRIAAERRPVDADGQARARRPRSPDTPTSESLRRCPLAEVRMSGWMPQCS